jgi:hypothetical protein
VKQTNELPVVVEHLLTAGFGLVLAVMVYAGYVVLHWFVGP